MRKNTCKFVPAEIVAKIWNEGDGYRSYLDSVSVTSSGTIFSKLPIINLFYKAEYDDYILLTDETGHEWLKIGTDNSDNYYPMFIFSYDPRKDVSEYSKELGNLDHLDPEMLHAEKFI